METGESLCKDAVLRGCLTHRNVHVPVCYDPVHLLE